MATVRKAHAPRPLTSGNLPDPAGLSEFSEALYWRNQAREATARAERQLWATGKSFWRTNGLPLPTRAKSFQGFLSTVAESHHPLAKRSLAAERRLEKTYRVEKAAMQESSGALGGYTVPPDYTLALMEVLAEESYLYPRATVLPMRHATLLCPRLDVETKQALGNSPFVSGIRFHWGFEKAPQETEPTFRQLELTAWDLLGYLISSNQLLDDIGPLGEKALFNLFGRAAAWYMEYAFLQGTGSADSMPLGVLNAAGAFTINRSTIGQILQKDIANMANALLPFSWQHCIWMCSPTTLNQVIQIPTYFANDGSSTDGSCGNLLTRPLFVSEKLSAVGARGDLLLLDPRLYVVGQRADIVVDVTREDAGFVRNQSTIRVWLRVDGKPWLSNPVTLADGVTQAAGYVILQ